MSFHRAVVRQLGKPALLAATYKGDAAGIAAAAMEEVGSTLINCLHELERLALLSGGQPSLLAERFFCNCLQHIACDLGFGLCYWLCRL